MKTLKNINVKNKTVLVRVDYNVPLADGAVADDLRIRASVPTLTYLREHGAAKIILISHLGRPEGRDRSLSLRPVAEVLKGLFATVDFVDDVSGPDVEEAVAKLPKGGILLLENLRFWPGEKKNDADFMREIVDSTGAEVYVQDGFAVVHRAHASTDAVTEFLPVVAGLLVEKEVENLSRVLEKPARPFLTIIGGSKGEDKAELIEKFAGIADQVVVGGKIAADGYAAPEGLKPEVAKKIYVADDFDEDGDGAKLDIGPLSTGKITEMIAGAKTVIWNGVLGKVEDPAYATASTIVAEKIGEQPGTFSVICGGDTTGFVENLCKEHPNLQYSLISTGGGAALEFLLGHELPGLAAIEVE